jgi:hypothetical protein
MQLFIRSRIAQNRYADQNEEDMALARKEEA